VLLAVISLSTLALSLLHGQALAGLGLVGSLLTPALVASTAPSAWTLFTFLAITWLASATAARIRRWTLVPVLSNLGLALWVLAHLFEAYPPRPLPPTLALLVMIAGTGFVWPGAQLDDASRMNETPMNETWWRFLGRRALGISLSVSIA